MEISYVPMRETDVPAAMKVYNHYVRHTTATFHINEQNEEQMRALLLFDDPVYQAYTIRDLNVAGILGYCILAPYNKREAYAHTAEITVYLDHSLTSKGLGSEAAAFLEKEAKSRDIHVLIASICGENSGSIRMVEKLGYEQCGHFRRVGRKFGRWLDVIYYQKFIGPDKPGQEYVR